MTRVIKPEPAAPCLSARAGGTRMPAPRLYLYFEAIIRHGSIRSAAEALRIASSALNRRVLDLEREAGAVLFDRLPSGVRLTPAGALFAAHVRRTLRDLQQLGDQIQDIQGLVTGHIAIGSAESAAMDLLPPTIVAFEQDHPGARFTLAVGTPSDILSDLLEDRVDMILTHTIPAHYDVRVVVSAPAPFCALMRADHPLAARKNLKMAECQDFPVVLAQEDMAARQLTDSTLTASSLNFQPVLVTNMFEVMKKYVRVTDAVCFQFRLAPLANAPSDGLVAIPLADEPVAQAHLTLAVRRGRVLPPGAAAMAARLEQRLRPPAR
jgi:DNA-binding transcriptional LysR family regulator